MVGSSRYPLRCVLLLRRFLLIRLTGWVRQWEKRPLTQRKHQVLLVFGGLALLLLTNLVQQFQAVDLPKPVTLQPTAAAPADSIAHYHEYRQARKNRVKSPIQ